ncbi:MAG: hypothetical protein CSA33_08940 [Desulfobulbus propionicus]|nr:MAG: hypothetical protein CSA33_08940 [Desulfobulbus propionicus]
MQCSSLPEGFKLFNDRMNQKSYLYRIQAVRNAFSGGRDHAVASLFVRPGMLPCPMEREWADQRALVFLLPMTRYMWQGDC